VEEGHEMGVVKPGTAQKAALKTVFVYIYGLIKSCSRMLKYNIIKEEVTGGRRKYIYELHNS
jgi:hypothetical protein